MRWFVLIGFLVGAIVWPGRSATAQRAPRIIRPQPMDSSRVTAVIDRSVQQAMNDAEALVKQEQYVEAVTRFQSVLDHSEDFFINKDFKSKSPPNSGVKAQTNWILANRLPAQARAAYELHFGTTARALLNDGLQSNNVEKLEEVVSRYQMTSAGFDAMQWLATSAFDHDRPLDAALLCEAMTAHPKATDELLGTLLFRTAFAWNLAGKPDRSRAALNSLKNLDLRSAWRIGGRQVAPFANDSEIPDWIAKNFGRPEKEIVPIVRDWDLPRGGLTGNESATPAFPLGGGEWTVSPLKHIRFQLNDDDNRKLTETFDRVTEQLERTLREENRSTFPSSMPIVAGDTVVYRTLNDVTALSLRTGQLLWRSSISDGMLTWLRQYTNFDAEDVNNLSPVTLPGYFRHKLFRDQLSGSITSDGKQVFAIEEADSQFGFWRPSPRQRLGEPFFAGPINKLVAYDLEGGRLAWEAGGIRGTPPADLSDSFSLGPPLPYAGRLYCLAEVKDELCLLSLIADSKSVRLDWSQTLITFHDLSPIAWPRRQSGLIPTISDGLIICPTSNGSVVAFDLRQRQLRWGYTYEPRRTRGFQNGLEYSMPFHLDDEIGRWIDGGPLMSNGRLVITPRDSEDIHCVDYVDGRLLWKRPRDLGLYVGCIHDDAAIVVGRTQIVALSLADGSEVWAEPLEIPEPSGRGVRIGSKYLLPLSTGEIATVDLSKGQILGRSKLPDGRVPGNLVVGTGALVSRGNHEVIGFRPLGDVESQIARQLLANPNDPDALALRGEMRLHNGEVQEAIDDLRESLRRKPQLKVKRILAGTLLNVLSKNLTQLLASAPEMEDLTEDPHQRIEFLRLYIQALSIAGDRVGAVKQLLRLADLPQLTEDLIPISPGYSVSIRQDIRSQLLPIDQAANPDERLAIVRLFEGEMERAIRSNDRALRVGQFVKLTSGHPAAEVLLKRLAESNTAWTDPSVRWNLLAQLARSADQSIAAFAVATLAENAVTEKSRDAMIWIDELRGKYPAQISLKGKTGQQLSDEWLNRDDVRQSMVTPFVWPEGTYDLHQRTQTSIRQSGFPVDIVTHVGRHFVGWSFEVDPSSAVFSASVILPHELSGGFH